MGDGGERQPQERHTGASALIVSAQSGHVFVAGATGAPSLARGDKERRDHDCVSHLEHGRRSDHEAAVDPGATRGD